MKRKKHSRKKKGWYYASGFNCVIEMDFSLPLSIRPRLIDAMMNDDETVELRSLNFRIEMELN
jgi:hypothetical protein